MDDFIGFEDTGVNMSALFVGHGSPTNAIEDNEFTRRACNNRESNAAFLTSVTGFAR